MVQTPVMDNLAENGIKLENYYVQPGCTPTRSQLMTDTGHQSVTTDTVLLTLVYRLEPMSL